MGERIKMKTSYRVLKLRSGEDIIAKINGQTKDKIIIERPMIFIKQYVRDLNGKVRELTVLKNWMSHSTEITTKIPKDYIATFLVPDSNVVNLYDKEKEREDLNDNPKKIVDLSDPFPSPSSMFPFNENVDTDEEPLTDNPIANELLDDMIDIYMNMKNNNNEENNLEDGYYPYASNSPEDQDRENDQDSSSENMRMKNYITMTMFLPPESLISLVDAGLLEMKDIQNLIDTLSDNSLNDNNMNNKINKENWGDDWNDWSPDPQDYL
jgi:hypothetical protein